MSQEYKTITKRSRRTRAPRNRPVLVNGSDTLTTTETASEDQVTNPTTEDLALDTTPAPMQEETAKSTTPARRPSRLPNFFKKTEQEAAPSENDVVEARMARARMNTTDNAAATSVEEKNKAETKTSAQPAASAKAQPARRPGLFKPRHIIGLIVYMVVANFVLPVERTYAINAHIEKTLFTIPSINIPISTSVLLNIITLILILYAMVALDFLPNGKQYAQQQTMQNRKGSRGGAQGPANSRQTPPAIRQGVKGEDDDLYQAYRQNQRNKKR